MRKLLFTLHLWWGCDSDENGDQNKNTYTNNFLLNNFRMKWIRLKKHCTLYRFIWTEFHIEDLWHVCQNEWMAYQIYGCHKRFSGSRLRLSSRSRLVFFLCKPHERRHNNGDKCHTAENYLVQGMCFWRAFAYSIQCTKFHFISTVFYSLLLLLWLLIRLRSPSSTYSAENAPQAMTLYVTSFRTQWQNS